ncbi:protease IV (signal peptide peptidase) [Candidatus Regiella insecticola LSR1]|uniref:Protease IV (Signal peptide peptidase) n=1 Tax=Candidatus Regiella insecticola LSR1 TaxID=663321 RepID=E0WQC3_9ENTR|nr:signal peptide peptidase SppA [Candidatus Regiella insecticola]EFL92333.1 protease IV (signal peptide peptidase) [Candidatus Regiella insecticola LSR1]
MRIFLRFITGFFRQTWRLLNFVRELVCNLFFILLIFIAISLYFQFQNKSEPVKGALLVDLNGIIVDKPVVNNKLRVWGRELLGSSSTRLQENSLFEIVETLRQAKSDNNITGIVLSLNNLAGADQPSLQYIGKALSEFRNSGKPIYAIGESYSQAQYYLASFANKIYLAPQGSVQLHGFSTNTLYYKSLLDKLKVSTHIFRVGTYKSAVEPMLRDNMSDAAREASSRWVESLWQNYLTTVAANRYLSPQQLFPSAPEMITALQTKEGNLAKYALDNKLVDQIASNPEVETELSKTFGWDEENNNFNFISIYDYQSQEQPQQDNEIAVILINGAIVDGAKTPGNIGGDAAAAQIRQARLDPKIKAVILRVNSPGGSASASEVIRAELVALRRANKPLVVSMGGMAASGGYWVSTPANYIIASPSTLTGSIGIFGVINTFENSLDNVGVHSDGVATSPLADVAITKALPPEFSQMMKMTIEHGYQTFIELVATARKKTIAQMDEVAQGRVWTGSDAQQRGLVDQLGDFDDAVKKVAELAKLKQYTLQWFSEQPNLKEVILDQINTSMQAMLPPPFSAMLTAVKEQPHFLNQLKDPQNLYALCLVCSDLQ